MLKQSVIPGLTVLVVALLDLGVAGVLNVAEQRGVLQPLVTYFDYGRSVPGKLDQWIEHPGTPGNLFDVAWRSEMIARSQAEFESEAPPIGPVVRSYGMSFVEDILQAAKDADPNLVLDTHNGPAAPPNFTYAVFLDDRRNRRPGDVAVLGILSSSVAALAAMSNRTWAFEQPAPFTYPVFFPEGDGLQRIEPLANSAGEEREIRNSPARARAWEAQLREYDAFYMRASFGWPMLDRSPFLRLLRRSLAVDAIQRQKAGIINSDDGDEIYPYREVLQRMIVSFAAMARADGQRPVVVLVQSRDPDDPDVISIARTVLQRHNIAYIATAEHFDPRNLSGFLPDGHYLQRVNAMFGKAFLDSLVRNP